MNTDMALIMTRGMGQSHFQEEEAEKSNAQVGTLGIKHKGLSLSLFHAHQIISPIPIFFPANQAPGTEKHTMLGKLT